MNPLPNIRPELARRIVWEGDAVRATFPGRFVLTIDDAGRPCWQGAVPVEEREFPIAVTYPGAYPAVPPYLDTLLQPPVGCPHILIRTDSRCRLCWIASNALGPRRRWNPQRHTAATVMRSAQRWALALLVWQATAVWPVPDELEV